MGKHRGDEASSTTFAAVAKRPKESEFSLITTPQVFSWIEESDKDQCGLIPPIKTRAPRSPECESTEVNRAPKTKGLIECPKQRAATFKRRLKGLRSGCSQLSTLCGVQVLFVYRTPGTEPQVQCWAPQPVPRTSEAQAHSTACPSQSMASSELATTAQTASALTDIDLDFSACGDLCSFSPMPASQVMLAAAEETASTLSPDLDLDFADLGCLF